MRMVLNPFSLLAPLGHNGCIMQPCKIANCGLNVAKLAASCKITNGGQNGAKMAASSKIANRGQASSKIANCGQDVAHPRPIIRHRKRRYQAYKPILPLYLPLLCFIAAVGLFKENTLGGPGDSQQRALPCMFPGFNHPTDSLFFTGCAAQLISGPPIYSFALSLTVLQRRSAKWIPRMTLTQRSHMLFCLILAGDIHPHPGPRPRRRRARRKQNHPLCPTCSQKVGLTKSPIGCDQCHNWFHAKCAGVTPDVYRILEGEGEEGEWVCCTCSLPFADSSRIDSGISSPDPPAPPKAQSTPIPKHTRRLTKHGTRVITTIIVNANSLKGKRSQLAALIKATSPHVLIITETKLAKKFFTSEIFDPSQFSVTRKDRNTDGGGIMVAVSTDINSYTIKIECKRASV